MKVAAAATRYARANPLHGGSVAHVLAALGDDAMKCARDPHVPFLVQFPSALATRESGASCLLGKAKALFSRRRRRRRRRRREDFTASLSPA